MTYPDGTPQFPGYPPKSTPPDIATRVRDALAQLGTTKDDVARGIDKAGALGRRDSTTSNPICRYLEQSAELADLGIYRVHDMTQYLIVYAQAGVAVVDTPRAVNAFLLDFDRGLFPALVEPAEMAAARLLGGAA